MNNKRCRNGYDGDLYRQDYDDFLINTWGMALVIALVGFFLTCLVASGNETTRQNQHDEAERFNGKPYDERIIIADWLQLKTPTDIDTEIAEALAADENLKLDKLIKEIGEADLSDAYLMEVPEVVTFKEFFVHRVPWLWVVIIYYAIFSLICFFTYWYKKDEEFFLCDLPLSTKIGICALISTLAAFPFYLVSLAFLFWWKRMETKRQAEAEREREERERLQAEAELRRTQDEDAGPSVNEANEEVTPSLDEASEEANQETTNEIPLLLVENEAEADRALHELVHAHGTLDYQFSEHAKNDYVACMEHYALSGWEAKVKKAQNQIEKCESSLRDYGDRVKRKQEELRQAKSDYQVIKDNQPDQKDRPGFIADFEAIKNMRGVTNIFCRGVSGDNPRIYIDVMVCYPWEDGTVYYLGDYRICIQYNNEDDGCFFCQNLSLPTREDYDDRPPTYLYENGEFCFGSRRDRIVDYIIQGKIREAVILMIDSLHSLSGDNEENMEKIPQAFNAIGKIKIKSKGGRKND